ncbi:MAG: hypothetical protein ACLQLT_10195 [Methylovirgula sp.]
MTQLARDVARKASAPNVWPEHIIFDFQRVRFIRPVGVVVLHNIIRWLQAKNCAVAFRGHTGGSAPLRYLHDSLFFKMHLDGIVVAEDSCRATTRPLIEVRHNNSHSWIRLTLIPWVAAQAKVNIASLYGLQSSMTEIFNNILDHSRYDIGSVFGQHFPSEHLITIAVSDMGLGIPVNVRTVKPELSDCDAIIEAVKEGFTTRSIETNAGMGLDQLMRSVVMTLQGRVTIYSGKGIVSFTPLRGEVDSRPFGNVGFCPGTTIEIGIDTRTIPYLSEEEEDLQW